MKTAISLPDDTFDRVSSRAAELKISRSEFFATAAQHYLDALDAGGLTTQIDAALDHLGAADTSSTDAVDAGHLVLTGLDDEW